MDAQIITALINLAGGALGLALIQGIVKWIRGHYNAVQRANNETEQVRRRKQRWIEHALILRRMLVEHGVTDLPPRPDDKRQ